MTPGFRVDVDEWKRSKTGLFVEVRNVTDSLQRLRADVFYQTNDKSMTNWIPAGMPGWYVMPQADNDLTQYGFSLQSDWQLGDSHYLIAGYEYNKDELDSVSPFGHKFGFNKPAGIMTIREYDGYQEMNAVYATMDTQLTDDFSVNYGVRYTCVDTQMKIEKTKGSPEPTTDRDSSDGKAVFNAGVMYTGIDNLTLRASYAQGYRHPILQELYIDSSMGGGNVKANPNLKPETSDNFELGARWNANGLNVDATLFYNMADNYIASREFWETIEIEGKPAQKLSGALMENVAKATTFGLELAASMDLQNGFEPYANITAMRRELEDINGWKTHDAGTPEFQARYGLRWAGETNSMNVRWDVYGITASDIKTTTRRKVTTKVPVTRHPGGGNKVDVWTGEYATRTIKHDGYTTFNMTAGIDFGAKRQYTIDAGIYNIFDEEYQLNGAIVEPGRHAAVKFNAVF